MWLNNFNNNNSSSKESKDKTALHPVFSVEHWQKYLFYIYYVKTSFCNVITCTNIANIPECNLNKLCAKNVNYQYMSKMQLDFHRTATLRWLESLDTW